MEVTFIARDARPSCSTCSSGHCIRQCRNNCRLPVVYAARHRNSSFQPSTQSPRSLFICTLTGNLGPRHWEPIKPIQCPLVPVSGRARSLSSQVTAWQPRSVRPSQHTICSTDPRLDISLRLSPRLTPRLTPNAKSAMRTCQASIKIKTERRHALAIGPREPVSKI